MGLSSQNIHATVGEFQRQYLYKIFIEDVPAPVIANFPEALSFQKEVDVYNTKAVFPDRKTDPIQKKWCGEFFYIPGVDKSTRLSEFEFVDDEPMWCYDFFMALKDLTGNEENQASVYGVQSKFNIGIAKVSVDKKTITAYRRLVGCRVYDVVPGDGLEKEGEGTSSVKVNIGWDRNVEDKTMRGKEV